MRFGKIDFYKIAESAFEIIARFCDLHKKCARFCKFAESPHTKTHIFHKIPAKIKFAESGAIFCHLVASLRSQNEVSLVNPTD
ncbi:hypothetical protein ACWIUD_08765 [Helicobacter sp. 23-1044]